MKSIVDILKVLSDEHRLRILMLLMRRELSVCQIMGIVRISQPLVSKNLSVLYRAGFLSERRKGKLRYYRVREDIDGIRKDLLDLIQSRGRLTDRYREDMKTLRECIRFQRKVGRCDMDTLRRFMRLMEEKSKG